MHTKLVLAALAGLMTGTAAAQQLPYDTFSVTGSLKIKLQSGGTQKVKFKGFKALKEVGLAISESPDEIPCEEREPTRTDKAASEVTIRPDGVPSFRLRKGSVYCNVLSRAKKEGVTFKIKTEVGVTGVTG